MSPQLWPSPRPFASPLALVHGVAQPGYLGPSVTVSDGIVTIVGRVSNGNGLTLTGSFQEIAVVPDWARPAGHVLAPASNGAASGAALVYLTSSGSLQVASTASTVAFTLSYPV